MRKYAAIYMNIIYRYSCTNYLDTIRKSYLEKISPSNIFSRIWLSLVWLVRDIINPFRTIFIKMKLKEKDPSDKIWILVASKNHYDSIGFLRNSLRDAILVMPQLTKFVLTDYIFPYYFKLFYYVKLPFLWTYLLMSKSKIASRYFNFLFEAIGLYEISVNTLKKYKPKGIIFANDHIFKHRALLLAAKQLKIKTCYIQHASVSNTFPPLSFDLTLLEGKDSLNKYMECGEINSKVKLVGMPKFDGYVNHKIKSHEKIVTIGIATNLLDDIECITQLIQTINNRLSYAIILLRSHPQDNRKIKNKNLIFNYSNARKEDAFDYLTRIDVLISGDSSIHLEAALLHKPSILYGFNEKHHIADYYEYAKNGLVQSAHNEDELIRKIENNDFNFNFNKLGYYNAVVGTKWEGKSKELITNIIKDFLY